MGDFIALDCPQFGNRIGDSCPALPSVAQLIGDSIDNVVRYEPGTPRVQASFHAGFSMVFGLASCQGRPRLLRLPE